MFMRLIVRVLAPAFFLAILVAASPLAAAKLKSQATAASAPALEWPEISDSSGGFSIEFSADDFVSVLYSTYVASHEPIRGKSLQVSPALWANLPNGSLVEWRVVSLSVSGEATGTSPAGKLLVAGGGNLNGSKTTSRSFSKKAKLEDAKPGDPHLRDELIVQAPSQKLAAVLEKTKDVAFPVERIVTASGHVVVRLQTAPGADLETRATEMRNQMGGDLYDADGHPQRAPMAGDVIIQPNYIYHTCTTPTDPFYASTPRYQYAPQQVHAPECWSNATPYTGSGVIVAVIDSGLNNSGSVHQEFNGAGKVLLGPDYVNGDTDPSDDNGHGSNVAGIIGAEADGIGMVGIAPDVTLMPIKTQDFGGSGSSADIAQGVDYAVSNGARVINMSLGSNAFASLPGVRNFDLLTENSFRNAEDRGVVVVVAAGNDHASLPASPAGFSDNIYVAAVTQQDRLTEFSNYGPGVTVAAPGYFMYSVARTGTTAYAYQSGTSQATPVVAGVVALLLQKNPALTPRQVKDILEATADDLGSAGHDDFYGFGRVNAAQALGITPTGSTVPALASIEINNTKIVATFTKNMLSDGSANAVNSLGNLLIGGGSGELNTFLVGASQSWDPTNFQLTYTGSGLITGTQYVVGWKSNVTDTGSIPIFCNQESTAAATRLNYCGSSVPGTSTHQGYGSAVAYANGTMKVLFRFPVTAASAQTAANYTLVSNPTNTGGPSGATGGSAVSLASAIFSYDTTSRILTISNLPAGAMQTIGSTFALTLLSGILNSEANCGIKTMNTLAVEPIYGIVRSATGTAPAVTAVANSMFGNNMREVVRITFNEHMRQDDAMFTPSNYTVKVNGSAISNPSDLAIMYLAAKNEVVLSGYDFSSNDGKSLQVTVANLKADDDSSVITGGNATSPASTINLTGSDFGCSMDSVTASTNFVRVQFSYYTKMISSTVTNSSNWILKSDSNTTPSTVISLASATLTYDSEQNALTISGLSLTAGNRFSIQTNGLVVAKKYATIFGLDPSALMIDVVGPNGDFSPAMPTAATVSAGGSNAANFITNGNKSSVTVGVTLPSSAVSGQKVQVTLVDGSSSPKTASGSFTLASSGAQTVSVTGLNASSFSSGAVSVNAMLTNSTGTGQSDIFRGSATADVTAPTVSSVAVQTTTTINVTFSEAMGTGVTTAANYTLSGFGKGTFSANPNTAALVSGNTYVLTWSSGQMLNGATITVTVANANDSAGNTVGAPNSGTHTNGGIGPVTLDIDGDGWEDLVEIKFGSDPSNAASNPPAGYPYNSTADADGDKYKDFYEYEMNTDPLSAASHPTLGDLNADGSVNGADAILLKRIVVGTISPAPYTPYVLDLNRDGVWNGADAIILQRFVVGTISTLPN